MTKSQHCCKSVALGLGLAIVTLVGPVALSQSLNKQLDSLSNHYNTKMGAEKAANYDQQVKAIATKVTPEGMLKKGDQFPVLTLSTLDGKPFDFKQALEKGPVVVLYYRGTWCPYCNMTLRNYQGRLADFAKRKATIIAISGEPAEKEKNTITRNNLSYPVLHDEGLVGAQQLGITYDAGKGKLLPLGAAYAIGKDGLVRYAFTETDYRKRAEADELLAALDRK